MLPTEQHEDYRNAIAWTELQNEVNPQRIGLWDFSYSGGHVLHLAAFDRRVKAIVAQMPTVNAFLNSRRLVSPIALDELTKILS
jgi:cephalosporin-C deacetylase-like acetyl esterase